MPPKVDTSPVFPQRFEILGINLGQYTISNDSIVEFIVHSPTLIPNISNRCGNTGDVSTLGGIFEGEISYIRMYFD